jgi:hypothetical protein
MKHLKKYKSFLEEAEFDVQDSDTPDVKFAKEKMATIQKQLADYKVKKPMIDKLYLEQKDPKLIQQGLETILGKPDIQSGSDRNPFLVEYVHISKLNSDIDSMQKENVLDKAKLDDFQQEMKIAKEQSTKDVVNKKITDINTRMNNRIKKIQQNQSDYNNSLKQHTDKMTKMLKDMTDNIKKISNVS